MLSDELGDGGFLLAIANVDSGKVIGSSLLVDGGVDCGLASLTIAVDQPTSDGDEGINGLEVVKKCVRTQTCVG